MNNNILNDIYVKTQDIKKHLLKIKCRRQSFGCLGIFFILLFCLLLFIIFI